jgi:hypothetical protein
MLPADFFADWSRHPLADGFMLVPAGGLTAGPIRVRQKVPLTPLRRIVDRALAESGRAIRTASKIGALERLVTIEGEHAGLVTVETELAGGARLERTIALIAGDDHGAVIDAATSRPDAFARYREVVRGLASSYYLGLGELRRRRYGYTAPPGWTGVARPYVTSWYTPAFPRDAAFISVFEARARAAGRAEIDDRSLSIENRKITSVSQSRLRLPNGLTGSLLRGGGSGDAGPIVVLRAHLEDERFIYLTELHAGEAILDSVILRYQELVYSIEPVPRPQAPPASALPHWLE